MQLLSLAKDREKPLLLERRAWVFPRPHHYSKTLFSEPFRRRSRVMRNSETCADAFLGDSRTLLAPPQLISAVSNFPIPVEDAKGTTLFAEFKAITLMRWIRKALDDKTFQPVKP